MGLVSRVPILGLPAAIAASALLIGIFSLIIREVRATLRLRDVEEVRHSWVGADGENLRRLILAVGHDLGQDAVARKAAGKIDLAGPAAAKRILSKEGLAERDKAAASAVSDATRQAFVLVTASPSAFLDSALLIFRAVGLLRQVATIYGYRPGVFALRSLALAAVRDAGVVAIADAFMQATAQSAAHTVEKVGSAAMQAGGVTVWAHPPLGALMLVGGGIASIAGHFIGSTGSAVGGGATAAWRIYRFGLMVLVGSRPLPFESSELDELKHQVRAEMMRLRSVMSAPSGKQGLTPAAN